MPTIWPELLMTLASESSTEPGTLMSGNLPFDTGEWRQCGDRVVQDDAGMIEYFLELRCCRRALVCRKVCLALHVNNV